MNLPMNMIHRSNLFTPGLNVQYAENVLYERTGLRLLPEGG